jgi:hypothetical protein
MVFRVQVFGVWGYGMRSRVWCVCVCVCVCDLAWLKKHLEAQGFAGFKCDMQDLA